MVWCNIMQHCFLTVSLGVLSRVRLTPPGVNVGLKDTERFPDTDAAAGTTSFCTGGRVESICITEKAAKYRQKIRIRINKRWQFFILCLNVFDIAYAIASAYCFNVINMAWVVYSSQLKHESVSQNVNSNISADLQIVLEQPTQAMLVVYIIRLWLHRQCLTSGSILLLAICWQ